MSVPCVVRWGLGKKKKRVHVVPTYSMYIPDNNDNDNDNNNNDSPHLQLLSLGYFFFFFLLGGVGGYREKKKNLRAIKVHAYTYNIPRTILLFTTKLRKNI